MSIYTPITFTVPAAGDTLTVQATGRSIVVLRSAVYTPGSYPTFNFGSEIKAGAVEMFPQSTYNFGGERFQKFTVLGTAQSAGDEITVLVTNECLATEINFSILNTPRITSGVSFEVDCTDNTVRTISELQVADADGNLPRKIYISCRGDNVVYAFNADPEQAAAGADGFGTILTAESDPVQIEGISFILGLRFRPATAGETPVLTVHIEY